MDINEKANESWQNLNQTETENRTNCGWYKLGYTNGVKDMADKACELHCKFCRCDCPMAEDCDDLQEIRSTILEAS